MNPIDKVPETVNVLGVEYKIKFSTKDTDPKMKGADGYFESITKEIYLNKDIFSNKDPLSFKKLETQYWKRVLRHELTHAFIFESGLDSSCDWALTEELVDWIALQFPKMAKCFKNVDILI